MFAHDKSCPALVVERVRQRNRRDVFCIAVVRHRRIDEEEHGKPLALARQEQLLGEAEALDLVEIPSGLERSHVESRRAEDRLAARIDRGERDLTLLA